MHFLLQSTDSVTLGMKLGFLAHNSFALESLLIKHFKYIRWIMKICWFFLQNIEVKNLPGGATITR